MDRIWQRVHATAIACWVWVMIRVWPAYGNELVRRLMEKRIAEIMA